MPTENRDYNVPEPGEEDWHVPVNENWERIDADMQAALDAAQAALDAATGDGSDGTTEKSSGGTGFTWDQTHVDTSWLTDADAGGTLSVETVTTLDHTGQGSLNAALDAAESNSATLIVFEVGGVIDTGGTTYIRSRAENVYIAGQTAPYPGITIVRGGLRIHESNTIVEHITTLVGNDVDDPHKARSFTSNDGTQNNLLNHCTGGWAPDTQVSFLGCDNSAYINGLNAEPLNHSAHPEAPHGYNLIVQDGSQDVAVMGNLNLHSWKRNPGAKESTIAYLNNYECNWGQRVFTGFSGGSPTMDWIGNVIEAGPDTDLDAQDGIFDGQDVIAYWEDNTLIPSDTPMNDGDVNYVNSPQNLPPGLSVDDLTPSSELAQVLEPRVGARPADRAPHEQRIIDNFVNRQGGIIDDQSEVGGYPDYSPTQRSLSPPGSDVLDWLQQYTDEVELGA